MDARVERGHDEKNLRSPVEASTHCAEGCSPLATEARDAVALLHPIRAYIPGPPCGLKLPGVPRCLPAAAGSGGERWPLSAACRAPVSPSILCRPGGGTRRGGNALPAA